MLTHQVSSRRGTTTALHAACWFVPANPFLRAVCVAHVPTPTYVRTPSLQTAHPMRGQRHGATLHVDRRCLLVRQTTNCPLTHPPTHSLAHTLDDLPIHTLFAVCSHSVSAHARHSFGARFTLVRRTATVYICNLHSCPLASRSSCTQTTHILHKPMARHWMALRASTPGCCTLVRQVVRTLALLHTHGNCNADTPMPTLLRADCPTPALLDCSRLVPGRAMRDTARLCASTAAGCFFELHSYCRSCRTLTDCPAACLLTLLASIHPRDAAWPQLLGDALHTVPSWLHCPHPHPPS
jgi:hypothetical protein